MAALSNQIHNRRVVFAPLQQVNSQSRQLPDEAAHSPGILYA
jgi:hypothetical protein